MSLFRGKTANAQPFTAPAYGGGTFTAEEVKRSQEYAPELAPMVKLTKAEAKLYDAMREMNIFRAFSIYAQYRHESATCWDFAIPMLGIGINCGAWDRFDYPDLQHIWYEVQPCHSTGYAHLLFDEAAILKAEDMEPYKKVIDELITQQCRRFNNDLG